MTRFTCFFLLILTSAPASAKTIAQGPAIPIRPGDEPWVITKVRVSDCRAVRGFVGAPVDGTLKSAAWDGRAWEYHKPDGGVGVEYNYLNGDGLHITLADNDGFNAVIVRGGVKARLLRDVQKYDQPGSGTLVHEFSGGSSVTTSRAWFETPVKTSHVSFFDVAEGFIADTSFFRVRRGLGDLQATAEPLAATSSDQQTFVSAPLASETSLTAIGVEFELEGANQKGSVLSISVQDPLNPRLLIHDADYNVIGNGHVHIVCDFPDQVIPAGQTITVTLTPPGSGTLKNIKLEQHKIAKEKAIVEALEHRKFIFHALYTPLSEARPWNIWSKPGDDEKYFNAPPNKDATQERLRPFVREMVTTLDQCRALDPDGKDPIVRQFYEWIYGKMLTKSGKLPKFHGSFDQIDGVPEWAALVHQAWMQAREVPRWWIEHRGAPNGEFGGVIGDDSDMYGNYAQFPMLERDGVGGMLLDSMSRVVELADQVTLEQGVNKNSMDPLHAYEEGMNLEAEVAYWNYGDPIYLERCMAAARSTEKMTVLTSKGHRHFRNNDEGVKDLTRQGPLEGEHGTHCLMWHPTLVVGWYNRNPLAMQWLTQWGDGWLEHMKSGDNGHSVKLPDDVTAGTDPIPFSGGWGMTGSVFTFLADLTGGVKYIKPYLDYFASTQKNTGIHFAELMQMGMIPAALEKTQETPWNAKLYASGDKKPFIDAIKKDIEELQRFPYMYTQVECFTDRVFLYAMINPSIAYTGGYTTRNKLNLTYAVSWNGFGTDYAALVTTATADHLKVLLCNISDKPISGKATLWRLEPGDYELTFGPDANNDDQVDSVQRKETLSITKGDEISVTLPPKVVQVLELKQTRKDKAIYDRADLAVAQREIKMDGRKISGVVHNIGSKDVEDVVVALLDESGKTVQTKHLGKLAAPLDLVPKTAPFEFDAVASGGSIVVDPDGKLPEIFKGNNRIVISR
jgi:hypothetical protein